MATLRTEVTEIVTGLAMLGYRELDHALGVRPRLMTHVDEEHFDRLTAAREAGKYTAEFETAWTNGQRFAFSEEGLRGRPPWLIEWKGPHRPPAYEQVPADLRVDHVYLISCKYGSNILMNASPGYLFEGLLADRQTSHRDHWYRTVSPDAYNELWRLCRRDLRALGGAGEGGLDSDIYLPTDPTDVTTTVRNTFKAHLRRGWLSEDAEAAYRWLAVDVSDQSAKRWNQNLGVGRNRKQAKEEMIWRLLRFSSAPYFVLGSAADGTPLHYRVATPWDFRQRFELLAFDAWGDAVGQPLVRWQADVADHAAGTTATVEGHVEVRWSHGRFGGNPEAKIYLDSPHHQVPGYLQLSNYEAR